MVTLPMKSIEALLVNGLKSCSLNYLPHACLPEPLLSARLKDELEWNPEGDPKDIEAVVRQPVPLFEFQWGVLELDTIAAEDDMPASITATLYAKETLNDIDLLSCLSDTLPGELGEFMTDDDERLVIRELVEDEEEGPETVEFSVSDDGTWASAKVTFWLDGKLAPIEKQWEQVGLTLSALIYSIGDLVKACIFDISHPESMQKPGWQSPAWRVKG
ncbi:hypothetical protein A8H39_01180 [Paraburkholderia fungorum]|uniref:hypothetical protein n=1 Tax=Paraburkholderia fungorum TaxID=134537 RepID=UPI0004865B2F|nr:hypothetical protein [Paraburkholderia fungorum]PNE59789.1 hypothetical protein A8H39_01180 [Paraburkholderia fungorum]